MTQRAVVDTAFRLTAALARQPGLMFPAEPEEAAPFGRGRPADVAALVRRAQEIEGGVAFGLTVCV